MTPTLDYAAARQLPPPRWMLVTAACFGAIPLIMGILITLAYVVTWDHRLQLLGIFCIAGGTLSVGLGLVLLGVYVCMCRRGGSPQPAARNRNIRRVAALLLVNFLAAVDCFVLVMSVTGQMQVRFINQTASPITGLKLTTRDGDIPLGDLPPQSRLTHTFRPANETSVGGVANIGGMKTPFEIDGYVELKFASVGKTVRFTAAATRPVID